MGALIYLDNNATTRTDPAVVEAMLPWFSERYGNAGSAHTLGHLSGGAVAHARERVAALLTVVGLPMALPALQNWRPRKQADLMALPAARCSWVAVWRCFSAR